MAQSVYWETKGLVTRLWLNRPAAFNALDERTAEKFKEAAARIAREPSRVVVLSGQGAAFCAGGDIGFILDTSRRPRAALKKKMKNFYASFLSLRSLPQATIAQVNGAAVGAGLCLALACDVRTALASAKMGLNFVRLGLNPGMAAWPLARAVLGEAKARELLLTARFFTGRDLHAWGGCAVSAATRQELERRTSALAEEIAANSGAALRLFKAETRLFDGCDPFLAAEAEGQSRCFRGRDLREGVAALRQRRAPRF